MWRSLKLQVEAIFRTWSWCEPQHQRFKVILFKYMEVPFIYPDQCTQRLSLKSHTSSFAHAWNFFPICRNGSMAVVSVWQDSWVLWMCAKLLWDFGLTLLQFLLQKCPLLSELLLEGNRLEGNLTLQAKLCSCNHLRWFASTTVFSVIDKCSDSRQLLCLLS